MKNLFNNEFGFSLVQGMIIAGVVAGSGLVATRLITDQKLAQKSAETRDQIEDLHTAAYAALQNRDNCKATFGDPGVQASLLATTSGAGFQLPAIKSASNDTVLTLHNNNIANTYMNGNVLVKDMRTVYNPATGTATLDILYERLNSADATKKTKTGYGAKEIKKSITLRVQRNPFVAAKPFESCYGVNSGKKGDESLDVTKNNDVNKDLCLQMNNNVSSDGTVTGLSVFVWDELTSTCLPNAKCPDHMVYTGIESTGKVMCKSMADVVDMNTMIEPTVGTCGAGKRVYFRASADGKKVSIVCE